MDAVRLDEDGVDAVGWDGGGMGGAFLVLCFRFAGIRVNWGLMPFGNEALSLGLTVEIAFPSSIILSRSSCRFSGG